MSVRFRDLVRVSMLVAGLGGGAVQSAMAEGDPEAGRALAERWCVSCHMIDPGHGSAAATGVPTFQGIANMPSTTTLSLRAFLRTPHVRMPDLHLTNQEIEDVSAFILGLRRR